MIINQLRALNFRNYRELELNLNPEKTFQIIYSPNGMGKSNLLEMIYYFSHIRSFRHVADKELVTRGEKNFFIECTYSHHQISHKIAVKYGQKKEVSLNDKPVHKYSEMLGQLLTVLFSNEDIFIINGSPSVRRRFFDLFFSLLDKSYLQVLSDYQKTLKQKNLLLKDKNNSALVSVYNQQMSRQIVDIMNIRERLIKKIDEIFKIEFQEIGKFTDKVKMIYRPSISIETRTEDKIFEYLQNIREREFDSGFCEFGIHRDNYLFLINGLPFTKYASFGQTRLASLVLKLVQTYFYEEKFQCKPILLLDDVILELDQLKKTEFLNKIMTYDQLFITLTNKGYLNEIKNKDLLNEIGIEHGQIK